MKELRILIADDQMLIRNGIVSMLIDQSVFKPIIQEASSGAEVLDLTTKRRYDLILLEGRMSKMDCVTAIRLMRKNGVKAPVLSLYDKCDYRTIKRAIKNGILGIILKNTEGDELINAIIKVSKKLPYYCDEVSKIMFDKEKSEQETEGLIKTLTNREMQVLELVAQEMKEDEIAEILNISKRTVEGHKKNLRIKLNVKNNSGLIRFAYESGYLV